ncbi:thioredoxin family protein [Noviherbaspirillum sp. UKPF54]|uniref:thioredoxin family protein n=1 Tax=Noviherbaspirillum sp. UKPF54 TaxID=2601898 RepID=UPI0011B16BD7|nr:thioredoxin family protein [Noviherbaspirillum sp. UKPF54]QDZ27771.1 thioredoxin family protein [Noviherbaspirillum sp. UKPF54]
MAILTLQPNTRAQLTEWLSGDTWVIACLCAAWCDTCRAYRSSFDDLAARHPDKRFVWIDIEDEADVVGDIDVENFPTLLMQRGENVAFFGTVLPDVNLADRLIAAQAARSDSEIRAEAGGSAERQGWQRDCNLRARLNEALG